MIQVLPGACVSGDDLTPPLAGDFVICGDLLRSLRFDPLPPALPLIIRTHWLPERGVVETLFAQGCSLPWA